MGQNKHIFIQVETPPYLKNKILARINKQERFSARIKLTISGFGALFAIGALGPAILYAIRDFNQSGLYEYISLLFSDTSVFSFWKEIGLSIIESMPIIGIMLVLGSICILLISLQSIARYGNKALLSTTYA